VDKIRVAVLGYGNVGKYAAEAVMAAPDMELAGIIVRRSADVKSIMSVPIVRDHTKLGQLDVVALCAPTRSIEDATLRYLEAGLNTVDSFDIHSEIPALRERLDAAAKKAGKTAIISAGWDPGSNSVLRALLEACAPKGITYTNFGPGMSMGHTVAAKSKPGVKAALSMTIPVGSGIHRRMVYVELEEGAVFEDVAAAIKADDYFRFDETHIAAVDDVGRYMDKGHGVNLVRKGVSGITANQFFEFNMRINNPALTSQVMVSCIRAAMRQQPGCYTMIELPPVDLLPGSREDWIARLV
jgi:diaminopimelate dehydrogenase